jgi:peptidoglycan hydrolase-like protein with peptidoglycan-binding domain
MTREPRPQPMDASPREVVHHDSEPGNPRHLSEKRESFIARGVMQDERGVAHVERRIGIGKCGPVGDLQPQPRCGSEARTFGNCRIDDLPSGVDADDGHPSTVPVRICQQRDRDVGCAGTDVEKRDGCRVRDPSRGEEAGDRRTAEARSTKQPIHPPQVPEVAGQRGRVVQRPVKELRAIDDPFHRRRLHRGGRLLPSGRMTPSIARRRLAVAALAGFAWAAIAGPVVAAVSTFYPTQSLGDRGTDVRTIQHLINEQMGPRPVPDGRVAVAARDLISVTVDGVYGPSTVDAIRVFQGRSELPVTGVVDPATWRRLVVPVASGASGQAVLAVQRLLREKMKASLALDGVFGSSTRSAVIAFQKRIGLSPTGTVGAATWRALVWHFELPRFSTGGLCDYSVGNGPANWGTASTVSWIEAAAAASVKAGYGRVAVGDISFELGGDIPGHQSHERGLDVDLRPMRDANDQCTWGTNYRVSSYDRAATRALIKSIRSIAKGHVKVIYFNDPVLISEGLTSRLAGHDDHLHVRFCEASHPVAAYDC